METEAFFGTYLVKRNLITEKDMLDALKYQSQETPSFIDMATRLSFLSMKDVYEILNYHAMSDYSFEEIAQKKGFLTAKQVEIITTEREKLRPPIGEILVLQNKIQKDVMPRELDKYHDIKSRYHDISEMLKSVKMFHDIPEHILETLAYIGEKVTCRPYDRIVAQNEEADCFYAVISGSLKVSKNSPDSPDNELFLYKITKNDVFGVSAIFESQRRMANVTCEELATLLKFEREQFLQFLKDYPKASYHILMFIIRRLLYRLYATSDELAMQQSNVHGQETDSTLNDVV
ncbi:MAG: cyclic nucleotide-binding domain-containing protein [Nitrospirae bacterium]|nr:cyclic nucleotide-binding domain-containing protein [Nitrospirota bacterium]MBF0535205.1 cyclic nucleotide-binding domain-containing protein [Nitrospirota bacterium]MBF0615315.1 cyclic nucleotide-binding domain-containing protein [Nitrospirota bacterium]